MVQHITKDINYQKKKLESLKKKNPQLKFFQLTEPGMVRCMLCDLILNYRDVESLKKHVKCNRHSTARKLNII